MARTLRALRPGAWTLAAAVWILAFLGWAVGPAPAAVVNVSNAENIRFDGQDPNDWVGWSVDAVGDVNFDGRVDIAIGAPFAGNNGRSSSGSVYVIYGTSSPADLDLNALGTQGFRIDGAAASNSIGEAVSQAGDFNNDGVDDLMVGGGSGTSAVYVIWGQDVDDIPNLDLLAPTNPEQARFMKITSTTNDSLGDSLGRVGDFNGDGRGDIVMGAPGTTGATDRPGSAFVVYGESASDPLDLSLIATGSMGRHMRITGAINGDQAGYSVAGAGDFNGDGFRDVVVGAPEAEAPARSNAGLTYVVYGSAGDPADVSLLQINGTQASRGFRMDGADADDAAGTNVSPAGDFNGDGRSDIAVGAYNADIAGRINSGAVYIVYGQGVADPADFDLLQAPTGGTAASRAAVLYGGSVVSAGGIANVGDFNNDSLTDVFVASTSQNWVAFSETTADPADLDLNTVNASPAPRGYRVDSPHTAGIPGHWVSGAGDFDGNGTPDLLVGKFWDDPAGRSDAGSTYLLLDTTAPDTSIDSGPSEGSTTNDNTPTFTYSGSPAAQVNRFECTLDGFARTCSGGSAGGSITLSTTADGVHTFAIKAVDSNGNNDATAATRTFTIDATPPSNTINSGPGNNSFTADTTPTFGFSSTDATATFTCRLWLLSTAAPAFGPCTGPGNTHTPNPALADGFYRFQVVATDPAGNVNPTPAVRDFTVDTVPPTLSIDDGPEEGSATNDSTPTFFFSQSGATSLTCVIALASVPNPAFGACNNPQGPNTHTATLTDNIWTFRVRGVDQAGNQTTLTRTFTVDTVAPGVSFTSGPFGPTNDTTPTWGFSVTDATATVECAVAIGDPPNVVYSPCSQTGGAGSFTADPALTDGPYTAAVRATDAAGNQSEALGDFTIDTVAPTLQITGGPQGLTPDATPEFSFAPEAGASLECAVAGGNPGSPTFAACSPGSGVNTHSVGTELPDGTHTFHVRATDAAGNPTTRTRSFVVDTTPPDTVIDSGPAGTTPDRTPTFGFHATEAGGAFQCRFDSAAFSPCSGPGGAHTPPAPLGPGAHTFLVRASDQVGNTDPDPAVRTFLIDENDPPTALIRRTYAGGHRLALDGSRSSDPEGPIATFRWFIDGALVAEKAKTTQEFDPAQASYDVRLVVIDADGARDAATATVKTPVNPDLKKCKLRYARARVFVFSSQNRIRLVIRYRSAKPATVFVQFKLRTKRGKVVPLGEVRGRFRTRGLFRLPLKRTDREMRDIRNAKYFVASFFVPGTPNICRRAFTRKMNNPKRISGQIVWFQPFGQL